MSLYDIEAELQAAGYRLVAGADEAGRGACAGPMSAAAVILDPDDPIEGLNDSKKLTAHARDRLYEDVIARAVGWSCVMVSPAECDKLGMHVADLTGLARAVMALDPAPDFALTDGFAVDLPCPSQRVVKGDARAACIAAASIVAKVTRDRLMCDMDAQYPHYGFAGHKGYCTPVHQAALEKWGPCEIHRMSYANVARCTAPALFD